MRIEISKSSRAGKKYQATANNRTIHFGQKPYEDFTMHRDESKRQNYIKRHGAQQDWSKKNVMTPGFMSRFVLWEAPTVRGAVTKLNKKYPDIKFTLK